MDQYTVTGMSCAACSNRVEKAVKAVEGVESCSVSLLTNSMGVTGTAGPEAIIQAVTNAGYHAEKKERRGASSGHSDAGAGMEDALKDTETPRMKKRLIASLIFWLILMYFSMGNMLFGWPLPAFVDNNPVGMGLLQLLLTVIIMVINQRFFVSGFKSLLHKAPSMDTLVALGAGAAFVYSTVVLFGMTGSQGNGEAMDMQHMDAFYFESAATILTLITVGKMLEAYSKGKTTDALKSLMKITPKTAVLLRDGEEVEVAADELAIGDCFLVKPGEAIPADGVVKEGKSAVNESSLTGESIPVDKAPGDRVSAATINQSGFLKCEATRVGEDTTFSQIIQMVSDAAATKAPIAKIADKVSGVFVPAVLGIAAITVICWLLAGHPIGHALARGIAVLVISCPCALGLATPVAIMVGNGVGAKNGILFKTAASLESAGKTDIVIMDKTGTITIGKPKVTDIQAMEDTAQEELLAVAYSLEQYSEHPLAGSIKEYAKQNGVQEYQVTDFENKPGNGVSGTVDDVACYGGNENYARQFLSLSAEVKAQYEDYAKDGKTVMFFWKEAKLLGMIAVADVIKADGAKAVSELKGMGIKVVMLTGDHENTAKAIGRAAGVDEVIADVLPDGKEAVVKKYQEIGKVAMVGDGINDAPALTSADVGIAIGAGTDVAIDAADIVLMKDTLADVPAAIRLSRSTLRNIHENLFWAFIYNTIGIPLAAGVFTPLFHWELNPMFAAAAMSLSSFCVVTNALRLNFCALYDSRHDKVRNNKKEPKKEKEQKKEKETEKENKTMTEVIEVRGMMCGHCEATVKKALEKMDGIEGVVADHEKNTVTMTCTSRPDENKLKEVIEELGYEYGGVQA